jgi:cytochrome P450
MPKAIPEFDTDPFSRESVRNARAVDDRLRELAPVVKLPRKNITMLARFEHVAAGLKDWKSFSSTSRPWHDPNSVRPELLLTDDPPKHTRVRAVVANALAPRALSHMVEAFRRDARSIVDGLRSREGQTIDAVDDITQPFVYKVLPDLIGLPWETPERFDVRRNNRDNLGFGYGVHACVGRVLALLEAEALLGALAESVELFQPAGEPEPWMTTIGHGPIRLPVRMEFAAH